MLDRLLQSRAGNVAMIFALVAPVLLIAAGVAIDFQQRLGQKAALQGAADNLALRGARELLLENASSQNVEALILALAEKQYAGELGDFTVDPAVDDGENIATVVMTQARSKSFFLSKFLPTAETVEARASAQAQGVTNVCVIALEESDNDAIKTTSASRLNAPDCAILSNSTGTSGVNVSGLAKLTADLICSAGGALGGSLNYAPLPVTDCPAYDNPLADRVPPDVGGCDHTDLELGAPLLGGGLIGGTLSALVAAIDGSLQGTLLGYDRYDLQPGVYCGGIALNSNADAHFAPGVYVIKDGPLAVDFGARLYGLNVGFYLDGAASTFQFRKDSIIHLTAPKEGLMAGLLFHEASDAPAGRTHSIESSNARQLLGTIYLPRGKFHVASVKPVADKSAYTAIVAKKFTMAGSPTLVLNADYGTTDIPVPDGIGPTGGTVYLRD